jgi:hypothetical protein
VGKTRVRLFQAGDLPGLGNNIDFAQVERLVEALEGLEAWGYTHKPVVGNRNNARAVKHCNDHGVAMNLSANDLEHADELTELGIGPVCVTLPKDCQRKGLRTPAGRRVMVCPAVTGNITCSTCGGSKGALCHRTDRDYIIGFPAHGSGEKKVSDISKGGI